LLAPYSLYYSSSWKNLRFAHIFVKRMFLLAPCFFYALIISYSDTDHKQPAVAFSFFMLNQHYSLRQNISSDVIA